MIKLKKLNKEKWEAIEYLTIWQFACIANDVEPPESLEEFLDSYAGFVHIGVLFMMLSIAEKAGQFEIIKNPDEPDKKVVH